MTVYLIVIIVIVLISMAAFSSPALMARYQLNPWSVVHRKEYVRILSHAFLHVDWMHLLINAFVLFSFSRAVVFYFGHYLPGNADVLYLVLFLTAIPMSALYSVVKHRNNPHYNAVGASGAVSAVLFASIFFDPYNPVLLFAIIPIPGIIFGVLYLVYSAYMGRKQIDNIGHDAHFFGAVYGFIFPILYEPKLLLRFFEQLLTF
ncbi:rhomboid family intramembrane serine protease [Geofilum rhodophaeum]|uniref:rhomboid family intramembrane serine protease n=1 Tax=Geofilum rhodophaeum TaxID=1965019 RepID=UPI001F0A387E|nr:rhomboid family intramembrane serine protease [Geofilum rhodophaeum]